MRVIEACSKPVVVARGDTTVPAAARLMRDRQVGCLVVTKKRGTAVRPIGIITDRDLVTRAIANDEPLKGLTLGELIAGDIVTAGADDDLFDALKRMRTSGVRRMPVLDMQGSLVGLLSVDDVQSQAALMLSYLPEVSMAYRRRR